MIWVFKIINDEESKLDRDAIAENTYPQTINENVHILFCLVNRLNYLKWTYKI